jgi:hypothetical protein
MKLVLLATAALATGLGLSIPRAPQATPRPTVATYASLADTILALHRTEEDLVRSLLDSHFQAAREHQEHGMNQQAAAEMALFATEGDNAIGGVRKRLVDGGFNHNAAGEAKGIFDPGFVIVTKKIKEAALAASADMRAAKDDATRQKAWNAFAALAVPLLAEE